MNKGKDRYYAVLMFGAGDRSRTCTPMALAPKASASANSATPAYLNITLTVYLLKPDLSSAEI